MQDTKLNGKYFCSDQNIMDGQICVRGTRIPVDTILYHLGQGNDVFELYPQLREVIGISRDTKLPTGLFCKCENGTPCFDTIHEIEKWHNQELSTYKQELIEWAEGKKLNADPSLAFLQRESDGKVLDYYSCNSYDLALTDLINHIKGEK